MPLRDYQEQALSGVSAEWKQGARSVLLVLPTGGGKTAIASEAIRRAVSRGKRCLFIAHRRELIAQTSRRLTAENITHGIVMADSPRTNAPVQVCSVDTLRARAERPAADLVIWDECHHQASEGWRLVAGDYPNAHHIGLTATPIRADGKGLGDLFQAMVVGATVAELTARGFLVPCDIVAPAGKLTRALAQDPVDALLALGTDAAGQWPKTLVYARSVKESHLLASRYLAAGVSAAAIDGTTRADVRDEVLRQFASGEVRVVVNMAVLTEGFDVPDASVCIVARSVGHVGLWLQIVGRVLRPAPGKAKAIVLDLAGSVHEHGLPEDERTYSLDAGIIKTPALSALGLCRMCGALQRGYPCGRCGFTPPEVRYSVTGEPLVLVSGRFNPKQEKTAVDALAAVAAAKGYSPGWITHEFKKRYGYEIGKQRYIAARAQYESIKTLKEDLEILKSNYESRKECDEKYGWSHQGNGGPNGHEESIARVKAKLEALGYSESTGVHHPG